MPLAEGEEEAECYGPECGAMVHNERGKSIISIFGLPIALFRWI